MKINNLGSGITYENVIELTLRDADNQIIVLDDENQVLLTSLKNSSIATVKGFNSAVFRSGVATFDNFIVASEPGTQNIFVSVTSKAIDKDKLSVITGSTMEDDLLEVNLRF